MYSSPGLCVSGPGGEGVGRPCEQGGGPGEEAGRRLRGEGDPHHRVVHGGRRGSKQVRLTFVPSVTSVIVNFNLKYYFTDSYCEM